MRSQAEGPPRSSCPWRVSMFAGSMNRCREIPSPHRQFVWFLLNSSKSMPMKFIGNSSNSSGEGSACPPLSKTEDVRLSRRIPSQYGKEIKGRRVCLPAETLHVIFRHCLSAFLIIIIIWDLFVRKIPDLAKIHSDYVGRNMRRNRQTNKQKKMY